MSNALWGSLPTAYLNSVVKFQNIAGVSACWLMSRTHFYFNEQCFQFEKSERKHIRSCDGSRPGTASFVFQRLFCFVAVQTRLSR